MKNNKPIIKHKSMLVNIYLSAKDRDELKKISCKYHVSMSSIAEACRNNLAFYSNYFKDNYIYDEKFSTNSKIRPRIDNMPKISNNQASHIFTNCLKLYARKDKQKFFDIMPKDIQDHLLQKPNLIHELFNNITNELQRKRDDFWNYNQMVRNTARACRENKEYLEKITGKKQ